MTDNREIIAKAIWDFTHNDELWGKALKWEREYNLRCADSVLRALAAQAHEKKRNT